MGENDTPIEDNDMDLVQKHVDELSRRFDSVRIICTRYSVKGDESTVYTQGGGDFYAQYGAAKAWVISREKGFKNS